MSDLPPIAEAQAQPRDGEESFVPKWIAWESTRRCNLGCVHCRCSSELTSSPGRFDTAAAKQLIDRRAAGSSLSIRRRRPEAGARAVVVRVQAADVGAHLRADRRRADVGAVAAQSQRKPAVPAAVLVDVEPRARRKIEIAVAVEVGPRALVARDQAAQPARARLVDIIDDDDDDVDE